MFPNDPLMAYLDLFLHCPVEVVKQKKVTVLLQKALTFVPRVTIEPLNLIAKVINHLRIGFLVLVL